MRLQLSLLCAGAVLLAGCQTMNTGWVKSRQAVTGLFSSGNKTPAAPPPTQSAVTESHPASTAAANHPPSGGTPLNSFKVARRSYADETKDFGTPPVSALIPPTYHGPTPTTLAGGQLITTYRLHQRLVGKQTRPVLINTEPGSVNTVIPGSIWLSGAGQSGSFSDATETRLGQHLQALTDGAHQRPLVFYCTGVRCWSAYNAALRAVNLDYRKVYWYRGGLKAWYAAGLPGVQTRRDQW